MAPALAITLRARRAILSLPWTAHHQSNIRNTATGFTWHPFVVARLVRVYPRRSQSTAPFSILPKVVGKNLETSEGPPSCAVKQQGAPRNANGSLASAGTQLITSMAHAVRLRISITAPRGLTKGAPASTITDISSSSVDRFVVSLMKPRSLLRVVRARSVLLVRNG